jgi:hypothetical protein
VVDGVQKAKPGAMVHPLSIDAGPAPGTPPPPPQPKPGA